MGQSIRLEEKDPTNTTKFCICKRFSSPLHVEAVGALRGVEHAVQLGMTHIVIETDVAIFGEALRSSAWDRSPYGALFR